MSDLSVKLLGLIEKDYTLNEIVDALNLSHEQVYKLFRKFKQLGMDFNKRYYSNGEILYLPQKEIELLNRKNSVNIITTPCSDSFRALLIADLHIGSEFERRDVWDKIYDYCIVNGIHIIIIVGDFLDGISIGRPESKLHNNSFEQMEYAVRKYPFDKSILNFIVFGNHDIDSLISFGIDFSTYLKNFRHDIVPIGYGNGIINIKNDKILLAHPLCIGVSYSHDLTSNYLLIKGHQHSMKSIIGSNGNCSLVVPSLSDLFLTENEFLPGALDLSIKFRGGFIDMVHYEHLLIGDKIFAVSSTQYSVNHPKDRKFDIPIKYEEDLAKRKILKREKRTSN